MASGARGVPPTMRAFVLTGHGGPEKLVFEGAWPVPELHAGEVLIEMSACSMNNTDVNTRIGWYSQIAVPGSVSETAAASAWTQTVAGRRHSGSLESKGAAICGRVGRSRPT
jgi:hypothetical protein